MRIFPIIKKTINNTPSGPAGFSDSFKVGINFSDQNTAPTDAVSVAFGFSDQNAVPTDALTIGISATDTSTTPTDSFTSLKFGLIDTTSVPTDVGTFNINLAQTDSNAGQTETTQLKFPSPPDFTESNPTPTENRDFKVSFWLTASAGTGVTNPNNANGSNDAAVATLQSVALGTNPITMTSTCGANIPNGLTVTSALYRGWFKSVNVLATSTGSIILHSLTALFADVTIFSNSALATTIDKLDGSFTYDLIANGINTLAKIQSIQVLHKTNDAVAGVQPTTLTVDAGSIEIAGAFT